MAEDLIALSFRQPWLWSIFDLGKDVENRVWFTKYRGPILLHAAKSLPLNELESSYAAIRSMSGREDLPILGVCLGHQAIGAVFGGRVVSAKEIRHGKTSPIRHDGSGVFEGLPSPFTATRYHSLAIDPAAVPNTLRVTARTPDGEIMGVAHAERPVHGVQFHPESIVTEHGHRLLANFLRLAGLETRAPETIAA